MSKSQSAAPEGSPTHTPKIRIRGIDHGSPKYNELVNEYRGRLGAFHEKHQQQAAISGNTQYKAKVNWPGARASYLNNNGQETITLVVDPTSDGGEERVSRGTPWEFALIDFVVPQSGHGRIHFAAFMAKPETQEQKVATADTYLPVQGVTRMWYSEPEKDPILSLAVNSYERIAEVEDPEWTASLRVDLRRYPNTSISIDVHGYVEPSIEIGLPRPGAQMVGNDFMGVLARDGSGVTSPVTPGMLTSQPKTTVRIPSQYSGYGWERLLLVWPNLAGFAHAYGNHFQNVNWGVVFDWVTTEEPHRWDAGEGTSPRDDPNAFAGAWPPQTTTFEDWGYPAHPSYTGETTRLMTVFGNVVNYGQGGVPSSSVQTPPPDGTNAVGITGWDYEAFFVPTWEYTSPAPCKVKAVCVKNGNPWTHVTERFTPQYLYSGRWEVAASYPERPRMKELDGDFSIPSADPPQWPQSESIPDRFGMPKVGTLKIDTRTGSVAFEPA